MALSEEKIKNVLDNDELKAEVDKPETMERIQNGFEAAYEKIKDRLGEAWQDGREIYNMVMDKNFEVESKYKYVVIGALLYLVSPIDLLPEAAVGPVIGLVDDILVLNFAIKYAKPEIERYAAFKASGGDMVADAGDSSTMASRDTTPDGTSEA